jgi:hypothetical protein
MMLLTAIESVLTQWRASRTPANAELLEETYVDLIVGGLDRIAARTAATQTSRVVGGPGRR